MWRQVYGKRWNLHRGSLIITLISRHVECSQGHIGKLREASGSPVRQNQKLRVEPDYHLPGRSVGSFGRRQTSNNFPNHRKFERRNLMPITDAAEAASEGRFGEEAEDRRGQDLRAQEQEQEQECPEVRPEYPAVSPAQSRPYQS